MRSVERLAAFSVIVLLVLTATSCPGTEILGTGTGQLVIRVQGSNVGATRYEQINLLVSQILFRPINPQADASLGKPSLGAIDFPVRVDLANPVESQGVFVHPAGYRVTEVVISGISMVDDNPPGGPTCLEKLGLVPDPFLSQYGGLRLTGFPASTFQVGTGGGTVTVTFDAPAFVAAVESGLTCIDAPGSCSYPNLVLPGPCITAPPNPTPIINGAAGFLSIN